jgi:hypothetical protein
MDGLSRRSGTDRLVVDGTVEKRSRFLGSVGRGGASEH